MNVVLAPSELAVSWAARITATWRQSVEAVIETGRLIAQAKAGLPHGEFMVMCETQLPFGVRTADRLMRIGADPRITDSTRVSILPTHWGTLYELTKLDDETFDARIEDGTINPTMERKDITTQIKQQKRQVRERELGAKQQSLPQKKYGVILADPEWKFKPWSQETGMDRAADNHYPTSELCDIAARDVLSIAADDSVLFLWTTVPYLSRAFTVMTAWGFDYRSNFVWVKQNSTTNAYYQSTGYWFRNVHEHLLVGVRGKPPAPAPGTQAISGFSAPPGEHSEKPDYILSVIEAYFPSLPKIELNRRGPARPGWDAWGNEVIQSDATPAGAVMATRSGVTSAASEQVSTTRFESLPSVGGRSEPASVIPSPLTTGAGSSIPPHDDFEIPEFLKRKSA